jgi:hypothetical protein
MVGKNEEKKKKNHSGVFILNLFFVRSKYEKKKMGDSKAILKDKF